MNEVGSKKDEAWNWFAFRFQTSLFIIQTSRVPRAGIEPANTPGLSRTALPIGVSRRLQVVPDGIEPSFPACKTGVVAVGPQDSCCRSGEHVPKDLNPDLLVWNQQCYRYTKDVCLFQKWERKESHLSPTTTQLKAEGLQPPVWKRSQVV